jgi:hypothetical protein
MAEDSRMAQLAIDIAKYGGVTPARALAALRAGCGGPDGPEPLRRRIPIILPEPPPPKRKELDKDPRPYYSRDPLERVTVKK